MNTTKTLKIASRKLSFTKIDKGGNVKNECSVGWEYEPPRKGKNYSIFLGEGRVLRTSPVKDVTENFHSIIVRTKNSIYQLKYLGGVDEINTSV